MVVTKIGRIVKVDSKLQSKLVVTPYNWLTLKESDLILPDNSNQNIIFEKFHDPKEMSERITESATFSMELASPKEPLWPVDLTQDYVLDQKELAKRKKRTRMDEEEIVSMELAAFDAEHSEKIAWAKKGRVETKKNVGPQNVTTDVSNHQHVVKSAESQNVSQQTNSIKSTKDQNIKEPSVKEQNQKDQEQKETVNRVQSGQVHPEISNNSTYEAGFLSGIEEGIKRSQSEKIQNLEQEKIHLEEEINRKATELAKKMRFEDLDAIENELRDENSRKESALSEKIAETISELQFLKNEIMASGQEIFLEITKLASERILSLQIETSDLALKNIYDQCVGHFKLGSNLTVKSNEVLQKKLKSVLSAEDQKNITFLSDNNLDNGEIKFENESSVVQFILKKQIDEIVQAAKSGVFSSEHNNENEIENENNKKDGEFEAS